mmetsp:Transcript_21515/g.45200  ORF Transcript_21515/g.45200 Transcript_21515/m.45200 type:complete len:169 (-) Transcript_21515:71-577(-)
MIKISRMMQQQTIDKRTTATTKDESNLKFLECVPCIPDSALKSFTPYTCDTESSDDSDFDDDDGVLMPPPSPYKSRNSNGRCTDVFKLGVMSTLSRPRSESPKRDGGKLLGREMQRIRSQPNMEYGRASYNRGIGRTMLESVTECDKAKGKLDAAKKVAQFDALLEIF